MGADKVLGIVVGGRPAPGLNAVVASLTLAALDANYKVLGFHDGFKHLMEGKSEFTELTAADVENISHKGGCILRTSRANPSRHTNMLQAVLKALRACGVTHLVTVGGGNSGSSAKQLGELAAADGAPLAVAYVPKTIDNDVPIPGDVTTLGYQSARHVGVSLLKNLMMDAWTAPRFYIVVAMGRKTGHLALGLGKASGVPLTIIPEEFGDRRVTFGEVCDIVHGSILKRIASGRPHGVCVLAESLLSHMSMIEIEETFGSLDVDRDEMLRVRLDDIGLGRAVRNELRRRFAAAGVKVNLISKNIGYELRSADPIPYDLQIARDLGAAAVRYLESGESGGAIAFVGQKLDAFPIAQLLTEKGAVRGRPVDVALSSYEVARKYMLRVCADDDTPEQVHALAQAAGMSDDEFRSAFAARLAEPSFAN